MRNLLFLFLIQVNCAVFAEGECLVQVRNVKWRSTKLAQTDYFLLVGPKPEIANALKGEFILANSKSGIGATIPKHLDPVFGSGDFRIAEKIITVNGRPDSRHIIVLKKGLTPLPDDLNSLIYDGLTGADSRGVHTYVPVVDFLFDWDGNLEQTSLLYPLRGWYENSDAPFQEFNFFHWLNSELIAERSESDGRIGPFTSSAVFPETEEGDEWKGEPFVVPDGLLSREVWRPMAGIGRYGLGDLRSSLITELQVIRDYGRFKYISDAMTRLRVYETDSAGNLIFQNGEIKSFDAVPTEFLDAAAFPENLTTQRVKQKILWERAKTIESPHPVSYRRPLPYVSSAFNFKSGQTHSRAAIASHISKVSERVYSFESVVELNVNFRPKNAKRFFPPAFRLLFPDRTLERNGSPERSTAYAYMGGLMDFENGTLNIYVMHPNGNQTPLQELFSSNEFFQILSAKLQDDFRKRISMQMTIGEKEEGLIQAVHFNHDTVYVFRSANNEEVITFKNGNGTLHWQSRTHPAGMTPTEVLTSGILNDEVIPHLGKLNARTQETLSRVGVKSDPKNSPIFSPSRLNIALQYSIALSRNVAEHFRRSQSEWRDERIMR